jgi:HlyD family secretion protein
MNETPDKSSLLNSLRIDRAPEQPRASHRPYLPWAIAGIALIAVLAIGGYLLWPDAGLPVQAVMAQSAGGAQATALDASGYVVARREATLSAKIIGKLVEANLEEGERITKGQIVARLDDSNILAALREAQAEAYQAKVALENAELIYKRYVSLRQQGAISMDAFQVQKSAYDTARTTFGVAQAAVVMAEANEIETTLRAPFAGVVTDKTAQVGEIVAPAAAGGGFTRTGIATIVDMDSLEVDVDVSENYIDRVHPGQGASVTLNAYPDKEIPAFVIAIIPTADQAKGTVSVRVGMKEKDPRILPQMGARVSFLSSGEAQPNTRGVVIPAQAVRIDGGKGTLYVIGDDDRLEMRHVDVGVATTQKVTILSGLVGAERVAIGDFDKFRDGLKVNVQN